MILQYPCIREGYWHQGLAATQQELILHLPLANNQQTWCQGHTEANTAGLVPSAKSDGARSAEYRAAWRELEELAAAYGGDSEMHAELGGTIKDCAPPPQAPPPPKLSLPKPEPEPQALPLAPSIPLAEPVVAQQVTLCLCCITESDTC